MAEVEIGRGKSGRRAYGFDDIAIVPSRRTRDPEDVDISWEIDAYHFDLPLMAAAMDGVVSPATAIEIGRLGGVGVLNLEGVWTRYEDPEPLLEEISHLDVDKATARMQQIYSEPIKPELIIQRIREIKDAGVVSCASLTPQRTEQFAQILARRRARPVRHPGHGGVRRARVQDQRAAQPEALHSRVRHPGDRRWVRLLPGRPPPDAHRRGGRARRGRSRPRLHHPRRARHRRPPGHRHRGRPGRPGPASRRDRRLCARHRRRRAWGPAATSPRPSCAAPTR